jgi:hypothetical protein
LQLTSTERQGRVTPVPEAEPNEGLLLQRRDTAADDGQPGQGAEVLREAWRWSIGTTCAAGPFGVLGPWARFLRPSIPTGY